MLRLRVLNQTGKIRYSTSEPESPSVNVDKVVILLSSYVGAGEGEDLEYLHKEK
jgi:hypothetical protein